MALHLYDTASCFMFHASPHCLVLIILSLLYCVNIALHSPLSLRLCGYCPYMNSMGLSSHRSAAVPLRRYELQTSPIAPTSALHCFSLFFVPFLLFVRVLCVIAPRASFASIRSCVYLYLYSVCVGRMRRGRVPSSLSRLAASLSLHSLTHSLTHSLSLSLSARVPCANARAYGALSSD